MVVANFIKKRLNKGKRPNFYFYREKSGKEIDLIQDNAGVLSLYEIKASATFNSSFNSNMKYVQNLLKNVDSMIVIYNGTSYPPKILNFRDA